MKRSRNTNYLIPVYLCLVLSSHTLGCDECDFAKDYQKCDGNRVMQCEDNGGSHWAERMNCDDYNATCKEGEYTEIDPYHTGVAEKFTHGCAVETITCSGDTDHQCSEDNRFVVGCTYSHGPAAMVLGENYRDYPYCVEKSDGTVGFAWVDGECNEGESTCSSGFSVMECGNGVWDGQGTTCHQDFNQICAQNTDTDSSPSAQCINANPCSEETGEYNICAPEYSSSAKFQCTNRTSGTWSWSLAYCWLECVTQSDGSGKCVDR